MSPKEFVSGTARGSTSSSSSSEAETEETSNAPTISHAWNGDPFLQGQVRKSFLRSGCVERQWREAEKDLEKWGWRSVTEVHALGRVASLRDSEPKLISLADREAVWKQVDENGNREEAGTKQQELWTSAAWKKLHAISAEEGLVASGYERAFGEASRVFQFAKLYIFAASSGMYSCPLAMTDGAARICETLRQGENQSPSDAVIYDRAFPHLTSREPNTFWTSGQWMTEVNGGSDVANGTETLAEPLPQREREGKGSESWQNAKLYGYKWFTSATDAKMAFALARERDADTGKPIEGTKGLSLFYVEVPSTKHAERSTIQIKRLKDKLGTRQMPTAELRLDGLRCRRASKRGRGVATIVKMVNITRLHNSITASSYMRRMANITFDYARKRSVFGKLLQDQILAVQTLASFEVHARSSLLFTLEAVYLLGRVEMGKASARESSTFRILVPLVKLFTAKQVNLVVGEGCEFFGGQGYIEATGIPGLLRDSQVLAIWEGTTNVLCLDMLRAMLSDAGVGANFMLQDTSQRVRAALAQARGATGAAAMTRNLQEVLHSVEELTSYLPKLLEAARIPEARAGSLEKEKHLSNLRKVAFDLCHLYIAGLLVAHAGPFVSYSNNLDTAVARAWIQNTRTKSPGAADLGQVDYHVSKTIVSHCQDATLSQVCPRARF